MNPKAAKAFQEAQALQRSGKPSDAFEKCRIAIKAAKNDPDILAFGGLGLIVVGLIGRSATRKPDTHEWK